MTFASVPYGASSSCGADCPRLMQASGKITSDTPQQFLEFARSQIRRPGLINVLLLNSPGGSVKASISLGKVLRRLGTVVVVAQAMDADDMPSKKGGRQPRAHSDMRFVSGLCASACVYALAGGYKRVVPPGSQIAVHRMAGNIGQIDPATREYQNLQIYAGQSEINTLSEYIASMGVSPDLVDVAESVPHEESRVLTQKEIRQLRLAQPKL